jgi:putative PIN family toxin of toxin-antitoxin system
LTPTAQTSVVRLVLDTNAAVSGLLWHGNPGKLIDAAQAGSLTLYTSAPLLAELHGVLGREKFTKHLQDRELTATQIFEGYAALTTVVVPAIIAIAASAAADCHYRVDAVGINGRG